MGVFKVFKQKTLVVILTLITMLFFFNKGLAILPQIPSGSSGYYVIPFGTAYITAIFNNTQICADADQNFICTPNEITNLNAGQYMSTTAKIIFADKPVSVNLVPYFSGVACANIYTPSSSELKKKYILFSERNAYIVATQYFTQVNVSYSNGTLIDIYNLTQPGSYAIISSPSSGWVVKSNKPIFVFEGYDNDGHYAYAYTLFDAGKDFYVDARRETVYIIPLKNVTTIRIDENRDGLTDLTYTLYSGNQEILSGLTIGSVISSDKPVLIISKGVSTSTAAWYFDKGYIGYTFLNSSFIGSEYFIPYNGGCGGARYLYITPIQYKTTVKIINASGYVVSEYNLSSPSDYIKLSNPQIGEKIVSNKPILATLYSHTSLIATALAAGYRDSGYMLRPLSPSTIIQTPGLIGVHEYGTIKVRFFNPTSENLYNLSLEIYTHKNFTLVGGAGIVNVTIYKKDANSDAILSQDFVQKSYSLSGEDNVFSVSYQDSSLLSVLHPNEYIEIVYKVISNHAGYYSFRVNSSWKATHWY